MVRKIPDTITEQEVLQIVKAAKKKRIKASIIAGFYNCLRVSEVISLQPGNIDIAGGWLHIKKGKGCKDRDIPIQKPVIFYLRYFPVKVSRQALHKQIKNLGRKVLNKDIHFHTLRHSGASFYLNEKKVDIRYIQELLGHSRLATTEIYTHIKPVQLKNVFESVWK